MENRDCSLRVKWKSAIKAEKTIQELRDINGYEYTLTEIVELFLDDLADIMQRPGSWEADAITKWLDGHGINVGEEK